MNRCRDCEHLKLTYKTVRKEWTCEKKNKNKSWEETIFNNLCRCFESKLRNDMIERN